MIRVLIAGLFLMCIGSLFSQDAAVAPAGESPQRGSIPEELLRPQRGEAPRFPIDTVIGELGQGRSPGGAYDCAQKAAAAFLEGNLKASVFAGMNTVFLEGSIDALNAINPRAYRLGSGRQEPDGSVSYLVRFIGREEGITGELFIRLEERRIDIPPPEKAETETTDAAAAPASADAPAATAAP
ncbi:MAG: hypothetical protein FWH41_09390, partial [Treponema sp.]|nr:hypothetical protein [Treponema sp.]